MAEGKSDRDRDRERDREGEGNNLFSKYLQQ